MQTKKIIKKNVTDKFQRKTDDPSTSLFESYLNQYERGGTKQHQISIEDIHTFKLDRLPRWIQLIPKNCRILDAGCATGYLLGLLQAEGYTNPTGVEISSQLAPIARSHLPLAINIVQSDIREFLASCEDGTFDVILFHHVLEHIPRESTVPLLSKFRRCLNSRGYLNIKVPNASCLLMGLHSFGDFTHVVQFNERSLTQVLEAAGFDQHKIEFVLHPPEIVLVMGGVRQSYFALTKLCPMANPKDNSQLALHDF